jgi:hypothetical protein
MAAPAAAFCSSGWRCHLYTSCDLSTRLSALGLSKAPGSVITTQ